MTFEEARAQFPVLERLRLPAGGERRAARARDDRGDARGRGERRSHEGRGASRSSRASSRSARSSANEIAALVGVSAEQVALTASTTDGCNIVLAGSRPRAGRRGRHDDGRALRAHRPAARVRGDGSSSSSRIPERIVEAVTPRTRLVALSHVLWTTGAVLPGARAPGARRGCRSSSTERSRSGHPRRREGARLLHDLRAEVALRPGGDGRARRRRPEALRVARPELPLPAGATSPTERFVPKDGAARFDPNLTPTARRSPGCGPRSRRSRRGRTSARPRWPSASARSLAEAGCDVVMPESRATLVSWRVPAEESADVVARLAEAGVIVRDLPGRGLVRASVGWWNDESDLERLVAGAVGSEHVLRPRLRAADPADLRRGGLARRPRARGVGREPLRGLPRDARRAGARRRRDPPDVRGLYRFYEELALRFAERGYAALAFDYFGRTAGAEKRDDDFEYMPHVQQTTPAGVQADVAACVAHLRARRVRGGLHGRVLLRRPQLVARRRVRARARRRDRLLREARAGQRRLTRSDRSARARWRAPILALQGGDDPAIPVEESRGVRRGAHRRRRRARGRDLRRRAAQLLRPQARGVRGRVRGRLEPRARVRRALLLGGVRCGSEAELRRRSAASRRRRSRCARRARARGAPRPRTPRRDGRPRRRRAA